MQRSTSSTKETAGAIKVGDQVGTLEPGKIADMVSLEGDPSQDIASMEKSVDVIQSGKPVKLANAALI